MISTTRAFTVKKLYNGIYCHLFVTNFGAQITTFTANIPSFKNALIFRLLNYKNPFQNLKKAAHPVKKQMHLVKSTVDNFKVNNSFYSL